jgi:hypothetical protein
MLPCMAFMANCLCGKRLIVAPSPVTILGKGFVVVFFGKRLVVALLDGCILLGVLSILAGKRLYCSACSLFCMQICFFCSVLLFCIW